MQTVLVTGANRGIGLEFCRQYADAGWQVLACCRQPERADALKALGARYPHLETYALDVADPRQIVRLAGHLQDVAIDVLLNNAGVYGDEDDNGFGRLDLDAWEHVLRVNTLGPVKMAEAFFPHLLAGRCKLIVAITSLMGSIADNGSGGSLYYRSSKAALNAAFRSLSIDLKPRGVGVMILHPGWVRTDMGGSNAPLAAVDSVAGMRRQIEAFRLEHSGEFIDFAGKVAPW